MSPPRRRVNRRLCPSRPADLEFSLISRCVSLKGEQPRGRERMMAHNSHPFDHREVNVNDSLLSLSVSLVSSAQSHGRLKTMRSRVPSKEFIPCPPPLDTGISCSSCFTISALDLEMYTPDRNYYYSLFFFFFLRRRREEYDEFLKF